MLAPVPLVTWVLWGEKNDLLIHASHTLGTGRLQTPVTPLADLIYNAIIEQLLQQCLAGEALRSALPREGVVKPGTGNGSTIVLA